MDLRFDVGTQATPLAQEAWDRLAAWNAKAAGAGSEPLYVTVTDRGRLVGALIGATWVGAMAIDVLWVADDLRGNGLGRVVLDVAEREARKRGVVVATVDTFSFQAPAFYEKAGYALMATVRLPNDVVRYWFRKDL